MEYNTKLSYPKKTHERIKARYAGIISRKISLHPNEGRTYFEIMYFDETEKGWHIGYGSFIFDFVQTWLEEDFEPTHKRLDEAVRDLLSRCTRLEEARERANEACAKWEAIAESAERERDAAISDLETAMAYGGTYNCQFCKNDKCYVRGGGKPCLPKWRGIQGE